MKSPLVAYHTPASVDAALKLLSELDNARILAGGQSLMPMLNMRFAFPDDLIDINPLTELAYIREEQGAVAIGAMTRQREVEFSPLIRERLPLLHEAVHFIGHRQTRNRGTVGGSLCHLDPSAEIPTVAMATDATLQASSVRGTRRIEMADFPAGYMSPALEPDEMLTGLSMPVWPEGHGWAFMELSRRHGDFAIVAVAALVLFERARIARVSLTLGGIASAPVRVREAEACLLGSDGGEAVLAQACALGAALQAASDSYVPGWYRQRIAGVLIKRALATAVQRARR